VASDPVGKGRAKARSRRITECKGGCEREGMAGTVGKMRTPHMSGWEGERTAKTSVDLIDLDRPWVSLGGWFLGKGGKKKQNQAITLK